MRTTVADLAAWLERFAPAELAEAWDNVGLLLGDPATEVRRVMTCLTVTDRTAAEAIAAGAGAIVSHHPILFKAAKAVRADRADTAPVWKLARAGVAVLSPHTSFDNTRGGINDGLADRLGLVEVGPIRPRSPEPAYKVVAFVPRADREAVLRAGFEAGAGRIGDYAECSFRSSGVGTFFGLEGSEPAIGRAGHRAAVREWRIELACAADRLPAVVAGVASGPLVRGTGDRRLSPDAALGAGPGAGGGADRPAPRCHVPGRAGGDGGAAPRSPGNPVRGRPGPAHPEGRDLLRCRG